jgi:hypothetical protein
MSEGLTFAGFAAMFRLGLEKITMTKADAVRLAEMAQVASDEITRLRAKNARLRAALISARIAVSHACEDSGRLLYTLDVARIDAALGEKE